MQRTFFGHVAWICFWIAAMVLGAAATALGQSNPLGDGHLLDNNLSLNTRINTQRRGFLLNRINESIVTGTIGGGRAFRGGVGYSSPFEFRGATADQSVYRFQRDSVFSSAQYQRRLPRRYIPSGGTAQLPRQSGRAGGALGVNVLRASTSLDLRRIVQSRYRAGSPQFDAGSTLRNLRRSFADSPNAIDNSLQGSPSLLDLRNSLPPVAVTSDPLMDRTNLLTGALRNRLDLSRDVRRKGTPSPTQTGLPTTSALPDGMPRNPLASPLAQSIDGVAFQEGWSNRVLPSTAGASRSSAPVVAGQDAYTDYLARLAARRTASTLPDTGQVYSDNLIRTMRTLAGLETDSVAPSPIDVQGDEATPPADDPVSIMPLATAELLELIKGNSPVVMDLSGENASRFSEQVSKAEAAINEGRYFDADRWFDVALAFSPGHPFAVAGKIHAELGAGMYRSAALNIRRLFTRHPELINTRYAKELMPPELRLIEQAGQLDALIEEGGRAIETGLVLAYIGHLLDRTDFINRGLDELDAMLPDDPLAASLRVVWLAEE